MGAEHDDTDVATRRPSPTLPHDNPAPYAAASPRPDGYVPPENADTGRPEALDQGLLSSCSRVALVFMIVLLGLFIFISPRPWYTLLFVLLALLPAFPILHFVQNSFQDNAVGRTFLLTQFFLGAVPLVFVVFNVEGILSFLIGFLVFRDELPAVEFAMESKPGAGGEEGTDDMFAALSEIVPVWKMIVFFLLLAYFTAGMVEEVGKWILARRYRKIDVDNAEIDPTAGTRIGCKGILAIACLGALGFAASENMGYVLGIALSIRSGFSFRLVGISLLRGFLAYPVHIGTQFYVAVSAAQWYVFKDKSSVLFALLIAVLFHGTFDGVAFVCMVLITAKKIPAWIGALVPVFDIFLIGALLLLCRGRYKALLERERLVLASDPV